MGMRGSIQRRRPLLDRSELQARKDEKEQRRADHEKRRGEALAAHPVYIETHGGIARWVAPLAGELAKGFIDIGLMDIGETVKCMLKLNDEVVTIFDAKPGINDIPGMAKVNAHDVVTLEMAGARVLDAGIGFVLRTF